MKNDVTGVVMPFVLAYLVRAPELDPGEDIVVRVVGTAEVTRAIESGGIVHSLGMLGILRAFRTLGLTHHDAKT
jgi:hypothetical protein